MRARHLSLTNFRGFESLELDFDERLTVLVGANGSGKTSVLDAVALVLRYLVEGNHSLAPNALPSLRLGAVEGLVTLDLVTPPPENLRQVAISGYDAVFHGPGIPATSGDGTVPLLALYPATRGALDRTPGSTSPKHWEPRAAWTGAFAPRVDFESLFEWFREREDYENEKRVQDGAGTDWRLDAVRAAVESTLPGFTRLRVKRPSEERDEHFAFRKPTLAVDKDGQLLGFDQLSEGERAFIALVADIARRLAIANPSGDPLAGEGIVMIDEVELHLHPRWQSELLERLVATFPKVQFIVTTHSPVVLSHVKAEQIRLLQDAKLYTPPYPVEGRDAGSILSDVFGLDPLPPETRAAVRHIAELVDQDKIPEAQQELAALSTKLGDLDVEVTRLRTILDLLAS